MQIYFTKLSVEKPLVYNLGYNKRVITCKFEDGSVGKLRHITTHVLVVEDDKILLVKRAEGLLEAGKWGFPGGFIERDETVQQGALRELREETGFEGEITGLLRINSYPYRRHDADRQNVVFEFLVKIGKKIGEPDGEQTEVKFRSIDELTEEEMAFDHYETLQILKKYLIGEVKVPII